MVADAPTEQIAVPAGVKERIGRAKEQIKQFAPVRNECLAFWRGDQYVHRSTDGYLVKQGTVLGERPAHRPRTTRNLIRGYVEAKVSAATQHIPSYEINPTSTDPEDISAASLAGKLALYGHKKWDIRRVATECITNALVMDGGYAMPYWDQTVPPYISPDGLGMGEIKVKTFSGNEVGWELGCNFHESPWHITVQGQLVGSVMAMPGYIPDPKGASLTPDAQSNTLLNSGMPGAKSKLVMVTEYLEQPSAKLPQGLRLVIANDRLVLPPGPYPCAEYNYGGVCLHELTYTLDPAADRDLGPVAVALDAQRTYNNATNQQISWAQLALQPQIIGPPLADGVKFTDEPGVYFPVVPINGMVPQWRPTPPMPGELAGMKEEAKIDLIHIFAADEIPPGVRDSRSIAAALEISRSRWLSFLTVLADFHADVMAHCLMLAQRYYTEPRLVSIRGRFGWERIENFKGADIRNQADVTVLAGSLIPHTREDITNKVNWLAQTFPGFVSPEAALAAIDGGTGDKLIESYELDLARAGAILQKIIAGPEVLFAQPLTDPNQPPAWAPRKFDNVGVHMHVFADYMKTPDYDQQPPHTQEACQLYYEACQLLKDQAEAQAAMAQQQLAEQMGQQNAARNPGPKPLPSTSTQGPGRPHG